MLTGTDDQTGSEKVTGLQWPVQTITRISLLSSSPVAGTTVVEVACTPDNELVGMCAFETDAGGSVLGGVNVLIRWLKKSEAKSFFSLGDQDTDFTP